MRTGLIPTGMVATTVFGEHFADAALPGNIMKEASDKRSTKTRMLDPAARCRFNSELRPSFESEFKHLHLSNRDVLVSLNSMRPDGRILKNGSKAS